MLRSAYVQYIHPPQWSSDGSGVHNLPTLELYGDLKWVLHGLLQAPVVSASVHDTEALLCRGLSPAAHHRGGQQVLKNGVAR